MLIFKKRIQENCIWYTFINIFEKIFIVYLCKNFRLAMLHVDFIIGFIAIPKILINRSLVKTVITEKVIHIL